MAIDMSTENTSLLVVSPRISFSHDLCHTGGGEDEAEITTTTTTTEDRRCRRDSSLLDLGNSDEFDFCISSGNIEEVQTSSAEELFSNGLIRTVHLQEKLVTSRYDNIDATKPRNVQVKAKAVSLPPLPTTTNAISKQESLKESVSSNSNSDHHQPPTEHNKTQSKSFWRIKRSSSLHCDNKKGSFWSLPLLSRSNSTGSVSNNPKQTTMKENHRHNGNNSRQQIKNVSGLSASSSSSTFYVYPLSQKPPLRRNYLGPNANGLRINPVLNVPSPHISKGTANLLGLGSFFRNGKEKKIKK